ncbi:hypothetical protein [Pseudomonas synxantha]|uniref:Phage tail fiber protein n=1 Tax=Pseudomonas synxantha TaxID=47883 RepID=A0AAU8TWH3_9PSED|nr:hypothetical protein [Pseudomonas synxantha]AKA86360.1 hypothetical protein VO64_5814 [Pseudomonas synxantha]
MTEITKKAKSSVKTMSLAQLRSAFETGAIPTDSDYAALIARADIGRQAVGLSEDLNTVTENQTGLSWTANGPLTIKLATGANNESGLKLTENGVEVQAGAGIQVDDQGVAVRAVGALSADEKGLHLKLGPGLELTADSKVTLKLKNSSGLTLEKNELAVKLAEKSGMSTENGLSLIVNQDFLVQNESGLSLVAGVVKRAVDAIGGALQEAIQLVTNYTIEASHPTPEDIGNSKVANRLQKTFSTALKSAKGAPIKPSLTGWAGSMRAELTLAHASGQGTMVDTLVSDATARNRIEHRHIYKADEGKGLFLAVRTINEMSRPRPSSATLIDAGGCIVAFKDSTAAVPSKLYVGYGGYYLNLEEAFTGSVVNIDSINFVLMSGCINGKSVLFSFKFPAV